jgi:hypothetical protein
VTTRLSSCARQGLARVVSTLVICGGLPLLIHAASAPAGDPITASFPLTCGLAADAAGHAVWTNQAALDDPDSSDDDGDDDVPGGGAAITVDAHHQIVVRLLGEPIHVPIEVWISHPSDGHALRGPPSLDDEDSSLSDNDDDDDEDDDDQLKTLGTVAAVADTSCRTHLVASPVAARAPNSPLRGHSLRAPPARSL